MRKFFAVYWRNLSYNRTRAIMAVVLALAYGSCYWGVGRLPEVATIATVQNTIGVMYSATNFMGMTNLYSVMPVVGSERIVSAAWGGVGVGGGCRGWHGVWEGVGGRCRR